MQKKSFILGLIVLTAIVSGCATAKPKSSASVDSKVRVQQLEEELRRKDSEIQYLKDKMAQNIGSTTPLVQSTKTTGTSTSSGVNVIGPSLKGVSVLSIQKALKNAGYYTGALDGKAGVKTKDGIKAYQKSKGLNPDGVVGEKTWASLGKYLQ